MGVTLSNLDDVFSYHKPKNDFQIEKYHRIRQAAKECARTVLETQDVDRRLAALEVLADRLMDEIGTEGTDPGEAYSLLIAAKSFAGGIAAELARVEAGPEADDTTTQAVIQCIRSATMWANAAVALEGKV